MSSHNKPQLMRGTAFYRTAHLEPPTEPGQLVLVSYVDHQPVWDLMKLGFNSDDPIILECRSMSRNSQYLPDAEKILGGQVKVVKIGCQDG